MPTALHLEPAVCHQPPLHVSAGAEQTHKQLQHCCEIKLTGLMCTKKYFGFILLTKALN